MKKKFCDDIPHIWERFSPKRHIYAHRFTLIEAGICFGRRRENNDAMKVLDMVVRIEPQMVEAWEF